ncbi:hypothetical protein FNW02_37940 [Komarekiella sp. 'clone 1']|uniref:Uncharacterized protein n=1 Tax=Komarekiella delphini-convector SJRDD-AB1 TaxID=2593771 RepID=A0AA40VW12_9NOST|nr:hypothetical protein [Komarekiella delphini-convector]MBD6621314.1 hypothetical protein [Komarekiella delphini-convector SJRDD-AB1]
MMTNRKQILYHQAQLDHNNKLVFRRRSKKVFKMKKFINRTIETIALASLPFTWFSGVGAIAYFFCDLLPFENT